MEIMTEAEKEISLPSTELLECQLSEDRKQVGVTIAEDSIQVGVTIAEDSIQVGVTIAEDSIQVGVTIAEDSIQVGVTIAGYIASSLKIVYKWVLQLQVTSPAL